MKFFLRIVGTWALGIAIVLLVKDIIVSLAIKSIMLSSISQTWANIDNKSWEIIFEFTKNIIGEDLALRIYSLPAWGLLIIVGIIFLSLGKKKRALIS